MEAFHKVAALPGSWRAQIFLARHALDSKDVPTALALYRESLQRQNPARLDALMQISGDLGNHGLLSEIIELCGPHFDPKEHGLNVGNNLLKAYVDLRDAPSARHVLEQLYAQQRPDWRENLVFWEQAIDKLDHAFGPVERTGSIELEWVILEGPIWGRNGTSFAEMVPAKSGEATKIVFVCCSAEIPATGHGDKVVAQPTDAVGRVSRGLPMFLAERVHIKTPAAATTAIPWVKQGGFVLAGGEFTLESLDALEEKPDYAVFSHIVATKTPWLLKFSVVRRIDGRTVAAWEQPFDLKDPAPAINAIAKRVLGEIRSLTAEAPAGPASELLFPPTVAMLPGYVAGLEQALAVFCSALAPDTRPFLHAERSIFDHLVDLCLRELDNVTMRLLLIATVQREAQARPDIALECRPRIDKLQREHPLREPAQGLAQAALQRLYAELESGPEPTPLE
jgi:hypothetical protein